MRDDVTTAEVFRLLQVIDAKLDKLASDFEPRIRRLERWMWVSIGLGIASGGASLASILGG